MSSMLFRASRVAARSACAAVSAASRRVSGTGTAGAATTPLPRSTPVASPLSGRYLASRREAGTASAGEATTPLPRSTPVASPLSGRYLASHPVATPPFRRYLSTGMANSDTGHVDFPVKDEDLESDEALWALYERWCKAFGEERSFEEMQDRFDEFKSFVLLVDGCNKKAIRNGKPDRLEVNMYADGKLAELQSYSLPSDFLDRLHYSESPIIGRAGPFLNKRAGRVLNKEVSKEGFNKEVSEEGKLEEISEDYIYPY